MEEILDQAFNENEKDETRINRVVIVFRVLLCAYFLFEIYRLWTYNFGLQVFYESTGRGFLMLGFILFILGLIVYNIRHIQLEIKYKYVIPYFKRGFIASFIALNLLLFIGSIIEVYTEIMRWDFSIEFLLSSFFILSISTILYREITYFIRATRLKRLKNE